MHILHLLIVVSFFYASNSPSLAAVNAQVFENELNSPSTDAAFDTQLMKDGSALSPSDAAFNTQVFENGPTLPPPDQPLDESSENLSPIPGSGSIDYPDGNTVADAGEAATEVNTGVSPEIVSDNLCSSPGSRPNGKIRARGQDSCAAPHTGAIEGPGEDFNGEEMPAPDMSMTKFNARPLGRGETMDDMCKRFLGGLLPNAVCSSGSSEDETYSYFIIPPIPFMVTYLRNCFRVKPGVITCPTEKSEMHCCKTYWMRLVGTKFVDFAQGCVKLELLRRPI